jgi:ABC-type bacteriocin/lantibiotic exporter with double-glycine peptidase domain
MSNSPKSGFALLIIVVAIALMMCCMSYKWTPFLHRPNNQTVEMEKRRGL